MRRDATTILRLVKARKDFEKAERENRTSTWYLIAAACEKYPNNIAAWSRQGTYTFAQFYDRIKQYAQWLVEENVKPGELVSLYLTNSPDFLMIWFACLCVGAAPAFINYNLEGKALLHCLNVAESKLLIVDQDEKCQQRIRDSQEEIEKTSKIAILDQQLKDHISTKSTQDPGKDLRKNVKGRDPVTIIYTR